MSLFSIYSKIKQFKYLWFFWMLVMLLALITILSIGSNEFSIRVNNQNTIFFDYFFKYITFLGDGVLLYIFSLLLFFLDRQWALLSIISLSFTTIIVQVLKRVLFSDIYRPSRFFKNLIEEGSWHVIDGVELYDRFSFPSGHTALSFCFLFIICYYLKSNFWAFFLIITAFLVGFSRIYLTQHFLIDVWFGSLIGSFISLLIVTFFDKLISSISFVKSQNE